MLFFKTRTQARSFAAGVRKVVDCGSDKADRRWAVKVL